jgi:hypothetical protein
MFATPELLPTDFSVYSYFFYTSNPNRWQPNRITNDGAWNGHAVKFCAPGQAWGIGKGAPSTLQDKLHELFNRRSFAGLLIFKLDMVDECGSPPGIG